MGRMAQRLWHPKLLQGLLRYGGLSVRRREVATLPDDADVLGRELERACPAAYQVLVDERCSYMVQQVRATAVPGAHVVLICGALHSTAIAEALKRGPDGKAI